MATVRLPFTNCRRKLPNLFLGACVMAVLIFCVNFLAGLKEDGLGMAESAASAGFAQRGLGLDKYGARGPGKRRLRLLDEDEEAPVCQMPRLTLKNDANKFAFYKMKPLECDGVDLFYTKNGSIHINKTILGDRTLEKCEYSSIEWSTDETYEMSVILVVTEEPFAVEVKHDFFRVQCYVKQDEVQQDDLQEAGPGRRKLLEDTGSDGGLQGVGSMGLPDPVYIQRDVKREDTNHHNEIGNANNDGESQNEAELAEDGEKEEIEVEEEESEDTNGPEDPEEYQGPEYLSQDEYYQNYEYSDSTSWDFDQYFAQVSAQEEVLERIRTTKPKRNSLQMNVLIFAIDSMSHLSYQRLLPRTYALLRDELKAVILHGYNIVGDATTAAMLPFLTGKNETELPEVRRGHVDASYVDKFPFVWNKYEQSGYVTLFAEDQPGMGTFQLRFNGFEERPVDHYIRPFWQAIHDARIHKHSPEWCLAGRPEHQYTLGYLRDFMHNYKDVPKFGFGFTGDLTHADNNPGQYIDSDLHAMLRELKRGGHLDNTLLVVMGDHGARYSKVRWTVQGKMEERLPFMSLTFPEKFKVEHAQLYKNLQKNADRLATPFDVHETLLDLLDIKRAYAPVKHHARGISLLHELPLNRTCESAHIAPHWCTCMQYVPVRLDNEYVRSAAQVVMEYINGLIQGHKGLCEKLRLAEIKDARMIIPNEKVLSFKQSDPNLRVTNFTDTVELDVIHYQLVILTTPNNALYEATVQFNEKEETKWQVYSQISRVNAYGNQPHCVLKTLPELRKYCYCTVQKHL